MKTEELVPDKKACCGCGACEAACPTDAISMRADEEGFLYPSIDAVACVGCGRCAAVCPMRDGARWKADKEPRFFAAKHRSEDVLRHSTSGGAFTAISDAVLARGGAVCGADFDEKLRVVHKMTDTAEGRDRIRFSKYVQSDMRAMFRAVEGECARRPVLFTGTPCQCAALLSYLGGRPESLFVCDLICHSIPSPLVWEKYKSLLEEEHGAKIAEARFRSKEHPWGRANSNRGFACRFEGGDEFIEDDRFYRLFIYERTIARPSCSVCPFTDVRRISDMTIADCFGIEKYAPNLYDPLGVSLIMVNTEKGGEMLAAISGAMELHERPMEESTTEQRRLSRPGRMPESRAAFWEAFRARGLKAAIDSLKK